MNEHDEHHPRKKRRWLSGCLVILGTGLLMLVIAWLLLSVLSNRSEDALRAKGYPTTLIELEDWYAKPPHGENAAEYYLEAGKLLERRSFPDFKNLPVQGDADLPPLGTPMPDEMRSVVAAFLEHKSAAFELIDEGVQYDEARYPASFTVWPGGSMSPYLPAVRNAVRAQLLRTLYLSQQGEPAALLTEHAKLVRVAGSLKEEPVLLSHMVSIGTTGLTLNATERILNENEFTREQLAQLEEGLTELVDEEGLLRAFIGERCFGTNLMAADFGVPVIGNFFRADYFGTIDEFIALAENGLPNQLEMYRAQQGQQHSYFRPLSSLIVPTFSRYVQNYYESQARIMAARAAITIQMWRLEGGELPDSISGFPESIVKGWPVDPFSGQPLSYKRLDEGFIVYSIGGDLMDDGGLPKNAEPDEHRGRRIKDVVFRILK